MKLLKIIEKQEKSMRDQLMKIQDFEKETNELKTNEIDILEIINVEEIKLHIISESYHIADCLKELLNVIYKAEKTHGYLTQYSFNKKNIKILVSKQRFEDYLSFLENEGLFIRLGNMTGKSIQLNYAGIPICIDSTFDDNEFQYLVRQYKNI